MSESVFFKSIKWKLIIATIYWALTMYQDLGHWYTWGIWLWTIRDWTIVRHYHHSSDLCPKCYFFAYFQYNWRFLFTCSQVTPGPWLSLKTPLGSSIISQVAGPVPGEGEVQRIQFNVSTSVTITSLYYFNIPVCERIPYLKKSTQIMSVRWIITKQRHLRNLCNHHPVKK